MQLKLSASLFQKIQSNRSLRGASRLFFVLKRTYKNGFGSVEELGKVPGFTKYQREKYLKTLIERGWLSISRQKVVFFLRSWGFVMRHENCVLSWKGGAIVKTDVDPYLDDETLWRDFLRGVSVSILARHMARGKFKNGRTTASPQDVSGDSSVSIQLSLAIVQKGLKISRSTASRWRISGQKAGLYQMRENCRVISNEECTTSVFARKSWKFVGTEIGERLVCRGSRLCVQGPNIITSAFAFLGYALKISLL